MTEERFIEEALKEHENSIIDFAAAEAILGFERDVEKLKESTPNKKILIKAGEKLEAGDLCYLGEDGLIYRANTETVKGIELI